MRTALDRIRLRPLVAALVPLIVTWLLATPQTRAQEVEPTEHPFLWTVEKEGLRTSYLYGTMHVPDERITTLPDEVWLAILDADALYTELKMDGGTMIEAVGNMFLPPEQSLDELIPAELYERLEQALAERGMPVEGFARMKVWVVSMTLEMLDFIDMMSSGAEVLDQKIYRIAQEEGMEVGGIETVDEQIGVFESMTLEEQIEGLRQAVERLEEGGDDGSYAEQAVQSYLRGDALDMLDQMMEEVDPEDEAAARFMKRILDDRNLRMAERAAAHMEANPERSYLFAFGAAHMPGELGVVRLLRDRGYTVTRVGAPAVSIETWIEEQAVGLDDHDDHRFLRESWDGARVIGLGEATHGTWEFARMKHLLLELLYEDHEHLVFAAEVNQVVGWSLDDSVRLGEGNAEQLLRRLRTSSVALLEQVEWMRAYNNSGAGTVEFLGLDVLDPQPAVRFLESYFEERQPALLEVHRPHLDAILAADGRHGRRGAVTGRLPVAAVRGRRLEFTGSVRTEGVEGSAEVFCRVFDDGGLVVERDLGEHAHRGDSAWNRWTLELAVPEDALHVMIGAAVEGRGRAWFDDLHVALDGRTWDPGDALDLDFEGEELRGFEPPRSPAWRAATTQEAPVSGARCLVIGSRPPDPARVPPALAVQHARSIDASLRRHEPSAEDPAARRAWLRARQCALILAQCMELRTSDEPWLLRDRMLAEQVARIAASRPEAVVLVSAHNQHVAREEGWMGAHLAERFGEDYVAVAFATGTGSYRGTPRGGLERAELSLQPPVEGSLERALQETGRPRLLLDLRSAAAERALSEPLWFRSVGEEEMAEQFALKELAESFDQVIWIAESTPIEPPR